MNFETRFVDYSIDKLLKIIYVHDASCYYLALIIHLNINTWHAFLQRDYSNFNILITNSLTTMKNSRKQMATPNLCIQTLSHLQTQRIHIYAALTVT